MLRDTQLPPSHIALAVGLVEPEPPKPSFPVAWTGMFPNLARGLDDSPSKPCLLIASFE